MSLWKGSWHDSFLPFYDMNMQDVVHRIAHLKESLRLTPGDLSLQKQLGEVLLVAATLSKAGATGDELALASQALLRATATKVMTLLPEAEGSVIGVVGREAQRFASFAKKELAAAYDVVKLEIQIGHVIAKHVGQSYEYLKGRVLTENIPFASTFKEIATARDVIYSTLEKHLPEIEEWAKTAKFEGTKAMFHESSSQLGTVVDSNLIESVGYNAKVVIVSDGKGAWSLLTSYIDK